MKNIEGAEGPLRFTALGPVGAWRGAEQLDLGSARQRAVLAVLLLHANRPVGRERLIEAVWGDRSPAFAVNQMQKYISALRRILEPGRAARSPSEVLAWSEGGYVLWAEAERFDLAAFESRVGRGRKAIAEGDAQLAAAELAEALDLWSGPALANVSSAVLDVERDRLAELRTAVLEERIEADLHLGRHGRLIPELTQLVAEFPLRERLAALLMLALFRAGRQAEALAVYDTTRSVLAEELGIDPGPELQRRHRQILTSDAALALDTAGADERAQRQPDQVPVSRRPEAAEELALRLDDARKMQIKAGDEARTAYALVFWLLEMVNTLQERVDRLEAEKRMHAPDSKLQQELAASHERLSTARKQLAQARRERERAEEIQLATQRLVEERLQEQIAGRQSQPEEAETGHEQFTGAEEFGLAPLYEVDHVLEASETRLKEQADQLDKLSESLDLTKSAEETGADDGLKVIHGQLADSATAGDSTSPDRPNTAGAPSTRDDSSLERGAGQDEQPPAAKPLPAQANEVTESSKWLPRGLLAGAAALVVLSPLTLTSYESHTVGLHYDMSNLPARKISNSSTPSYSFDGLSSQHSQMGTEDLWSTFTLTARSPTVAFERRLRAKLILSVPEEETDPYCSGPQAVGVAWTVIVNGENEIASGTLSRTGGDSATVNSDLPSEPETITVTGSASDRCEYELRLQKPAIRYRGLWGAT